MTVCEAFVINIKNNGLAEVVFHPDNPGIPGASEKINRKVCHCNSGSITIDAENRAKARPGDMVKISWDKTVLKKKVVALFCMSATGLLLGMLCAALFAFVFSPLIMSWILFPLTGLFLGLCFSIASIKKLAGRGIPRITRVIMTKKDIASMPEVQFPTVVSMDGRCDSCSGSRCHIV